MPPRRGDDPAGDSLAHLHRMSRTAGLGSGDYVAINVPAVVAVILGLGSAMVVVDPLFLELPLAGIVISIIAIVQVKNSNGTQSGMIMGIAGLILSLGFFTYKAGGQTFQEFRTREDRQSIERLLNDFGQDLYRGDERSLTDAYSNFDSTFTGRVPLTHFTMIFNSARNSPYFGVIQSIESNGQMSFSTDPRTGESVAGGLAIVHLAKGDPRDAPHWMMNFRKEGDRWRVEDMPELFPNAAANPQGQGQSGAAGAARPATTPSR